MNKVTISDTEGKYSWYGAENMVLEKRILFTVHIESSTSSSYIYPSIYIKNEFKCNILSKTQYPNGVPEDNIFGCILLDEKLYDSICSACDDNTVISSTYPVEGNIVPLLIPYREITSEITGRKIHKGDINKYKDINLIASGLFQFKLYFTKCIEDNTYTCYDPSHKKLWELHCKMINGLVRVNK